MLKCCKSPAKYASFAAPMGCFILKIQRGHLPLPCRCTKRIIDQIIPFHLPSHTDSMLSGKMIVPKDPWSTISYCTSCAVTGCWRASGSAGKGSPAGSSTGTSNRGQPMTWFLPYPLPTATIRMSLSVDGS